MAGHLTKTEQILRERDALREVYIAARRVVTDCDGGGGCACPNCELAGALLEYESCVDRRTLHRLKAISDGTLVEPPTGEV